MGWFTAHARRVVSDVVPARAEVVRAFYVDLDNLIVLHPLLHSVRTLLREPTADGYRQLYEVRDRVPVGRLTMPITYTAELDVPERGDVVAVSRQFPRVQLRSVVSFEPDGEGGAHTRLTELIAFSAPKPLARMVIDAAVTAHTEMLAGIRQHFQG